MTLISRRGPRINWPFFIALSMVVHLCFVIAAALMRTHAEEIAFQPQFEKVSIERRVHPAPKPRPVPVLIPKPVVPPPQHVASIAHTVARIKTPVMHNAVAVAAPPPVAVPAPAVVASAPPEPVAAPVQAVVASAAPATAAPVAAPPIAGSAAAANWAGQVLTKLQRFKRYPELARRRSMQGVVYLRVEVARDGSVISCSIDRSSGSTLLDNAALELVRAAAPLPPFTSDMPQATVAAVLPISYSLR